MSYDQPCRPTPLPARAPIPAGWRRWSHGDEAAQFQAILGVASPPGVVLIERCCVGRGACPRCRPVGAGVAQSAAS